MHISVVILFLTFKALGSTQFHPIEAGTLIIQKNDFQNTRQPLHSIQRNVTLQSSFQVFQSNPNITVLSAISSVNINQSLAIQFTYQLDSLDNKKIVRFNITIKNQIVMPDQLYIQIDFIVAQNLRVDKLNMTSFQQHIQNMSLTQNQKDQRDKQVHNQLFLFLNGFSSITIAQSVMYSYIGTSDMYVVHYMTKKGEMFQQGWINSKYFIMFSTLLLPKYPYGYESCRSTMLFHQKQNYIYECLNKSIQTYFLGLAGTNSSKINAQFELTNNGFKFNVKQKSEFSTFSIYGFPIKISPKFNFIDKRMLKRIDSQNFFYQNSSIVIILFSSASFLILSLALYYCFKNSPINKEQYLGKQQKGYKDLIEQKQIGCMSQKKTQTNSGNQKHNQKDIKIAVQSQEMQETEIQHFQSG